MTRTTYIKWRKVDSVEAERNAIRCQSFGYCSELATWCRQWQSEAMIAPAFWHYCTQHAEEGAKQDGIRLTIDA